MPLEIKTNPNEAFNVLSAIKGNTKDRKAGEELLENLHHRLMGKYGWIPFKEFKRLPIPTTCNLLNKIIEEEERMKKENEKLKKKSKGRPRRSK